MNETVGQRIRRLRIERGMSQRDASSDGMSNAYLSRIEMGERVPSMKALRLLSAKLGVSTIYLETGEESGFVIVDGHPYDVPMPVQRLVQDLFDRLDGCEERLRQVDEVRSTGR